MSSTSWSSPSVLLTSLFFALQISSARWMSANYPPLCLFSFFHFSLTHSMTATNLHFPLFDFLIGSHPFFFYFHCLLRHNQRQQSSWSIQNPLEIVSNFLFQRPFSSVFDNWFDPVGWKLFTRKVGPTYYQKDMMIQSPRIDSEPSPSGGCGPCLVDCDGHTGPSGKAITVC